MSTRSAPRRTRGKTDRATVSLDAATHAELRRRARLHKTTMAGFVRALLTGHRPGGLPGQAAAAADAWWDTLQPTRRAQIHSWITSKASGGEFDPDQLDIDTILNDAES